MLALLDKVEGLFVGAHDRVKGPQDHLVDLGFDVELGHDCAEHAGLLLFSFGKFWLLHFCLLKDAANKFI